MTWHFHFSIIQNSSLTTSQVPLLTASECLYRAHVHKQIELVSPFSNTVFRVHVFDTTVYSMLTLVVHPNDHVPACIACIAHVT
jgi:hypothetical protein